MSRAAAAVLALAASLLWMTGQQPGPAGQPGPPASAGICSPVSAPSAGCIACHAGLEQMHPWSPVSCVDCHGGNGAAATAATAHVAPSKPPATDERVAPPDYDLAYRRFVNPTDLRVVHLTCSPCHEAAVAAFKTSLHATTAGHLSDGLYENGVVKKRGTSFAIFPTVGEGGKQFPAVPGFQPSLDASDIPTHYRDVVRKNCMQCHAWSRGRAVRGRLGMDGDYRSEGCAVCHVTYSDVGFSESADQTINHREPGHPIRHELTDKIPTDTCTRCHYGDASIGLNFRGLAQLVPGQPAGPDVPGTTPKRQNGAFYLRDDALTPPDVHHAAGMQCVDCHTKRDVMGDGSLHATMDHAVEIECTTCHGTFEARADSKTQRGAKLAQLSEDGGSIFLTSKVTGKRFRVKQARDVVDPLSKDFNDAAHEAMTAQHATLECYTCHAGWTPNFFGFHFDRNESFTQLDLISGQRTPGRVNTLEKVFSTFKHLQLGINHEGNFAPYMVGFSTFCTAYDANGTVVVDQRMPKTAAGLSGMTMIHHQPHTTQSHARGCVECHRSGATWGLGTGSFDLARGLVAVSSAGGVALVSADRKNVAQSVEMTEVRAGSTRDVAIVADPVNGFAEAIYAATEAGLSVISAANPAFPEVRLRIPIEGGATFLAATDRTLYVACRRNGVLVFDLKDRFRPELVSKIPTHDARGLALASLHLFVADGSKGLTIVDVADPRKPSVLATLELAEISPTDPGERGAERVAVSFLNSRPRPEGAPRTRARQVAVVAGFGFGLHFVDVTEPARPFVIQQTSPPRSVRSIRLNRVVGLKIASKFDLGSAGGGIPSAENDYVYMAISGQINALMVIRITDPAQPLTVGTVQLEAAATGLALLHLYNPPFLVHYAVVPSSKGLRIVDVSRSEQPSIAARLEAVPCSGGVAVEAMPLDRMITEEGAQLKDIAHEPARYANGAELRRMLRARIPYNGPRHAVETGESAETGEPAQVKPLLVALAFVAIGLAAARAQEAAVKAGEAFIKKYDANGDYWVSFEEFKDAEAFKKADKNGDGRITIGDFLIKSATTGDPMIMMSPENRQLYRYTGFGTIAVYDRNKDGVFDEEEMKLLLIVSMDYDEDKVLNAMEIKRSRSPPGLMFEEGWFQKDAKLLDTNGDGVIVPSEMRVPEVVMRALDKNKDGKISLEEMARAEVGTLGGYLPQFQEMSDLIGQKTKVDRANWLGDPDLFRRLDTDKDGFISVTEFDRYAREIKFALSLCNDFVTRHDLDGDQKVSRREFPGPDSMFHRMDRNHDGFVTSADR